jgi:hypothetical protein
MGTKDDANGGEMRFRAVFVLLMVFPAGARAQSQSVVPMELARALLMGVSPFGMQNWVEIGVEAPPKRWAVVDLPGYRLLGSAAFPSSATLVYEVDGDAEAAREAARTTFVNAGWHSADMPIPTLQPPRGVDVRRAGSGGGGNEFRNSAVARTDMAVAQLLSSYAEQLRADGWRLVDESVKETSGVQTWQKKHSDKDWILALTGFTGSPRLRVLQLDLRHLIDADL